MNGIASASFEGTYTPDAIETRIRALGPWFHNLDLRGVRTAPDHVLGDFPRWYWQTFAHALPGDLRGRTVLDVGCNGGFYSIEMKRRGAARVVGIDTDERYLAQARLAADVSGLPIELHHASVYDVARLGERFDIVLFLGVFYHLRHPLLALDLLYEHAVGDLLVFQSMVRGAQTTMTVEDDYPFAEFEVFDDPRFPRLNFIESRYAGDPTNRWIPNRAGVEALLRGAGFEVLEHPEREVYICRREPGRGGHAVYPTRERGRHG